MKKQNIFTAIFGFTVFWIGIILVFATRSAALAEMPAFGSQLVFALSLILTLIGFVTAAAALLPDRKPVQVRTLAMAALFAALCYIGFSYLRIDIPVGTEKSAFHLGNVFCVLAALFIGGFWGGMAGAFGLTIADLTSSYVTSAPKTFLLKLCIGLISGLVAHKLFHLSQERPRRLPLSVATILSCAAGMVFNMVGDPVVGYFYKTYVLGVPQDAAKIWASVSAVTTSVNAVVAIVAASVLYLAIRPALRRANLLPQL